MACIIGLGSVLQGAATEADRMSPNTALLALFTDTPDAASSIVPAMIRGLPALLLHINV